MGDLGEKIGAGIAAIISLAVLAIVISNRANTTNVISAFFAGLSNLVGVAISPVTGQSVAGLSAAGLTGGTWTGATTGANYAANTSGILGNLIGTASSASANLGSLSSFGSLGSLPGIIGGTSGAVDSGSWDTLL